jgi:transposase
MFAGIDVASEPHTLGRLDDAGDATGLARLAFATCSAPTLLHDEVAEALGELVRHRDRLRQLHRLVDLGFPEFICDVRTLASQLATCLLAAYPTAHAFARATPHRLARLRYDGRHPVGAERATELIEAAKCSIGQHHGPAYALLARHICQDLDLWHRRLADIERAIENLLDTHDVGKLLPTIDGIGPQSAARIIAEVGNPARFRSPGALAAHLGLVPALRQSGKCKPGRAAATRFGHARLHTRPWMPTLSAVRRNPWLRAFYQRLHAAGKPPKLAILAAMRKLLLAVSVTARNLRPFVSSTEQALAT